MTDWDEVIIHVAMSMGWTLDYVKWNVDLPTLAKLTSYWRKSPPMHVLMARYVGHKPPEATSPAVPSRAPQLSTEQQESMESFFSSVQQRPHPKPVARPNGNRPEP